MKRKGSSTTGFFTMGVACLFLAVFFLTVIFGARTYRDIVREQAENNRTRTLLSYFSTCMRNHDTAGAVRIYEEDGRTVLSIADGDSGYGLRLYQYEGCLVEDYGQLEAALNPAAAQVIGETENFWVEKADENTYTVTTDEGKVLLRARSAAEATGAVADE